MNANFRWLWWITPALALFALLGVETGWGERWQAAAAAPAAIEPRPVSPGLLPEYRVDGGVAGLSETVDRTLFNPTRRPAPPATATAEGGHKAKAGQFVLTGTTLAGDKAIAFLKEVHGGKARTVRKGDKIDGLLVADVLPDRVRFTQGGESEEVMLKVAAGPKTTTVAAAPLPTVPAARNASASRRAAAAAARAAAAGESPPGRAQQPPGRHRGARGGRGAAENAAGQNPGATGNGAADAWARVYQRMQNGGGKPKQR